MMEFNNLDAKLIKEQVDLQQIWEAWKDAEAIRKQSFTGSMIWEVRSGREYLYKRKGSVVKSLGPRSPSTEKIHESFHSGRLENSERLKSLSTEINRQATILTSLAAGRLHVTAARAIRALQSHGGNFRVIGTNAMYAYERLAGVAFNSESTATGDVDVLLDDRNRLRLFTEDRQPESLIGILRKKVDTTFKTRSARDYRLTNDKGYMVEFVRPEPRPAYRKMPGGEPIEDGDVAPVPIIGLQWLVNSPSIKVMVLDDRGFPVDMTCPDPRHWASHKLWLSKQKDREPAKKLRDKQQADVMIKLIRERLPQYPFDDDFLKALPSALARELPAAPSADRTEPDW